MYMKSFTLKVYVRISAIYKTIFSRTVSKNMKLIYNEDKNIHQYLDSPRYCIVHWEYCLTKFEDS